MTERLFIATAGLALLAGCNPAPPPPEKTIQQLMAQDVNPTAYRFWDAVQYGNDLERGDYTIVPETAEDWKRARDATTRLVELGELLKTPGYAEGRGEDWIELANGLIDVSQVAGQAVDARDTDEMFEIGGTLYNVCEGCHAIYPPANGEPGETRSE